jgi:hypothetical protein
MAALYRPVRTRWCKFEVQTRRGFEQKGALDGQYPTSTALASRDDLEFPLGLALDCDMRKCEPCGEADKSYT